MQDYHNQLKALENHTKSLDEHFMIGCFLGGLKEEIHLSVQSFQTSSLLAAIRLTKLREKLAANRRSQGLATGH